MAVPRNPRNRRLGFYDGLPTIKQFLEAGGVSREEAETSAKSLTIKQSRK